MVVGSWCFLYCAPPDTVVLGTYVCAYGRTSHDHSGPRRATSDFWAYSWLQEPTNTSVKYQVLTTRKRAQCRKLYFRHPSYIRLVITRLFTRISKRTRLLARFAMKLARVSKSPRFTNVKSISIKSTAIFQYRGF